tara:strand:- start:942 stop:1160 length:219 start_codon:yes stop_codon:yes gene_type:complete
MKLRKQNEANSKNLQKISSRANRTVDPKQDKLLHKKWLAGELFENLPIDVIVVKVNSGNTKNRIGANSQCPN